MVLNLNHFGHALVAVGITGHVPPNGGVLRRRTPEALLPSTTTAWCRARWYLGETSPSELSEELRASLFQDGHIGP